MRPGLPPPPTPVQGQVGMDSEAPPWTGCPSLLATAFLIRSCAPLNLSLPQPLPPWLGGDRVACAARVSCRVPAPPLCSLPVAPCAAASACTAVPHLALAARLLGAPPPGPQAWGEGQHPHSRPRGLSLVCALVLGSSRPESRLGTRSVGSVALGAGRQLCPGGNQGRGTKHWGL